jgi:ATP-binding cassette, subfamily B, heavy metal transporter
MSAVDADDLQKSNPAASGGDAGRQKNNSRIDSPRFWKVDARTARPPRQTGLAASRPTILALLHYLWPRSDAELKIRVVGGFVSLVLAKLLTVIIPIIFGRLVDRLNGWRPAEALELVPAALIVGYAMSRMLATICSNLRDVLFSGVQRRIIRHVAGEAFERVLGQSLAFFVDHPARTVSSTIDRGSAGIARVLQLGLFTLAPTVLELLFVMVTMTILFDWPFALMTCVAVLSFVTFTTRFSAWRGRFVREMVMAQNEANRFAADCLTNIEPLKYFGGLQRAARHFTELAARNEAPAIRSSRSLLVMDTVQAAIIAIGLLAMMFLALPRVENGSLTIGSFLLLNLYLTQLFTPLATFGYTVRDHQTALLDVQALLDLLKTHRVLADRPGAQPLQERSRELGSSITFENVSFAYSAERPILTGLNFTVPAGASLTIVGGTGAGKSTIGRLLFRLYEPSGGRILIDGQDIAGVTEASLRERIAVVPQETMLLNDTIRANIAFGRDDATMEEIREVARLARLHDFVSSLPDGYDTPVGDRGMKLSGGERQRVAIARALLTRPAILVLDEATSALDVKTERDIIQAIRWSVRGPTTVTIAHRLASIVDADQILVLAEERVAETGRHMDLLARGGPYAKLWAKAGGQVHSGPPEERRMAVDSDRPDMDKVHGFIRDSGADWMLRPDIVTHATFTVAQLTEIILQNCDPSGPINVLAPMTN